MLSPLNNLTCFAGNIKSKYRARMAAIRYFLHIANGIACSNNANVYVGHIKGALAPGEQRNDDNVVGRGM